MPMLRSFALSLLIQAAGFALPQDSALNPAEKLKIGRELKIENRIKIYRQASERIQKSIQEAVSKGRYETLPANLRLWTSLLSESLADIRTNLKSKKKSKNLIRYEIQVRKAITSSQNYKIKSPVALHDVFDSCLAEAEKIRQEFVEILFKTNQQ